jgi:hypothetical protein
MGARLTMRFYQVLCIGCGTQFKHSGDNGTPDPGYCGHCGCRCKIIGAGETEEEHEEAATGAKRSSMYPKGAQFPARYDLMMRNAVGMRRLAETWGEGFEKYGADNWMKGFPASVLLAHAIAHIASYLEGDRSEDHLAHCAWNVLALCWVEEHKPELLDLTMPVQASLQAADSQP